jgi:hypothetical protein
MLFNVDPSLLGESLQLLYGRQDQTDEAVDVNDDNEDGKSSVDEGNGTFGVHGKYLYVTYSQSRIDDHEEFYKKLLDKLPYNTEVYGGKEYHKDGKPHYHVVMRFPCRVEWADARERLTLLADDGEVDTNAINIDRLRPGQSPREFLNRTQDYCSKNQNPHTFGKRILDLHGSRNEVYLTVIEERDPAVAEELLKKYCSYDYVTKFSQIQNYLEAKKEGSGKLGGVKLGYAPSPWKVPKAVEDWVRDNISDPLPGRKTTLVLIGRSRLGKTEWAKSIGNPIVMTKTWNLRNVFTGATHIVVNDCDAMSFGWKTTYWKEVMGCQIEFDATDRYTRTRTVEWNIPCIWTCNEDMDPRRHSDVRRYLEDSGAVVVELDSEMYEVNTCKRKRGDTPSEDCVGERGSEAPGGEASHCSAKRSRID